IMFRWILSIWLLAVAPVLKAQGGQLKFDHFPTNDGLPNPWIYSILQDHRGYMWFGTKNGLCRFDGRNYTNFVYGQPDSTGLPAYECSDLVLSADGDIWCINFPYLVSCDGSSLKLSISNRPDGKPWEMYTLNADSRGNFWGISNLNIYRFKPGKNGIITDVDSLAHIPTSQVNQMRFDQEGDLILATEDDNIYVFDTLTHELANYKIPLDETKVNWRNIIRCLKVDSKGRIWLGTYNYGLYLFDKHTGKFDNFLYDEDALLGKDIVSNMVRSIEETNFDGGEPEIWLGTYDKGLVKFDPLTKTFTIFGHDPEKPTSLRNNNLRSLYSTSDALWIGTSNGIDKYDCRNQQYQTTYLPEMLDDELRKSVYSVCVDWNYTVNHKIWYGSNGGGLYYLDTRTMQSYSSGANPPDQMKYVHGILPWSADTLLCCGYFGVFTYHIPTDTWKLLPSTAFSTNNKEVIDESTTRALGMVRTGPDEFIFTSNYFGVWRCNMKTGKTEPVNDMQRQSKSAEMLPDQRIAVTQGGLLAILNPDGRVDLLQSRDSSDEFLNGNLYNVSHDPFRNCLWVTSWTGLGTIDLVTGARRSYTAADGVMHRRSFDAEVDADGNVWVLCDGGLSYLRTGQSRFESIRLENITELPLAEVPELAITPDQQLAITLFNGMALIDLKRVLNPIRSSHRVEVSAYRSGNSQWDYHPADKLVFGHDQNTLEFILSCLSYTDPTRNTFSYMLDELHDGWVELDHLNRINLVNLEP
ncbi:MAG: hypothetical protein JNM00_00285, partial [Flavobacteriales bacterium]|nr:hypothetical protein [Flavobacteriales bacterium]